MVARISEQTNSTKGGFGSIFEGSIKSIQESNKGNEQLIDKKILNISVIRQLIIERKNDFEKQIMILAGDSIIEFNELKKSSVSHYLAKFENYISKIEALNKK